MRDEFVTPGHKGLSCGRFEFNSHQMFGLTLNSDTYNHWYRKIVFPMEVITYLDS